MAKKISQLTQATEVKSDDVTVIVQDGETKKLPLNMMVTKQDIENKKIAGLAKLDEIEATYENDTYTPTITVKNKSSVKTGEGDEVDYSANVMDGHAKSAILSGNTLKKDAFVKWATVYGSNVVCPIYHDGSINRSYKVYANRRYTVIRRGIWENVGYGFYNDTDEYIQGNIKSETFIPNVDGYIQIFVDGGEELRTEDNYKNFIVIEGEADKNIPYFEGMQSVKMPVLTTTGKNLFNFSMDNVYTKHTNTVYTPVLNEDKSITLNSSYASPYWLRQGFYVEEGKQYTITVKGMKNNNNYSSLVFGADNLKYGVPSTSLLVGWGTGDNCITTVGTYGTRKNVCTALKTGYITRFYIYGSDEGVRYSILEFQVEEGDTRTTTTYEPYKTNILMANEEVELRGIGNVQDTLDCLTGEVTQRIGEIVADGVNFKFVKVSQNMEQYGDGSVRFDLQELNDINTKVSNNWGDASKFIINDRLKTGFFPTFANTKEKDVISMWNKTLVIVFSDTNIRTVKQANDWLKQNPITIQYQLSEESVKTVDLMPSGTHPSTTPYCWKNGHIQLSSSGLLPNLEYSVVTSRAGQINQNATMIVKNDKRIFDLEILLAGGLVNTTYQALTLQNQVETGLSKVSLNSETEPDYLLYHMIMKLIEEKAYKLDDLTEKVSVFYLYEKLSDEQFETIYSALYPFVEDEIVEESVVEELPEVVEDEVIM